MIITHKKKTAKVRRRTRVRSRIVGTASRPRLSVFRSSQHLLAQLIDDAKGQTIFGLSSSKIDKGTKTEKAQALGEQIAAKAKELKITTAIFDRGFFRYHGRLRTFADAARKGGLKI